jgi:hypothetical protein
MDAIQHGHPPITSGVDNIGTLQLVHGAYTSAQRGMSINPSDL